MIQTIFYGNYKTWYKTRENRIFDPSDPTRPHGNISDSNCCRGSQACLYA